MLDPTALKHVLKSGSAKIVCAVKFIPESPNCQRALHEETGSAGASESRNFKCLAWQFLNKTSARGGFIKIELLF